MVYCVCWKKRKIDEKKCTHVVCKPHCLSSRVIIIYTLLARSDIRISNKMSCGLIGGRTLRLAAPSGHVWRLSKGPRVDTRIRREREGRRPKIEKRTKKIPRSPFIFEIIILLLYQPFKYKHKIPLFSPLPLPPSLSGSISFFSLLYTLFRFSLFCGLRRFALQLIISPFPISPLPYPLFHISRIVSSSSLFFSVSLSLSPFSSVYSHIPCPRLSSRSLFHHYYTRPYTAIMPRPRYTTQSAVMLAIKLN